MSEQRTQAFQRNSGLERLLKELNQDLQPSEAVLRSQFPSNEMTYPLILVMGPLRSGTTLLTQWLANTGLFAYPTNLLSRFYQSPILGAKIQLLLTDSRYKFKDELGEFLDHCDYASQNGKTKGVLAPNEFWYFWRQFLPEIEGDLFSNQYLADNFNSTDCVRELNGVMQVFQKPFVTKGMMFNYNIEYLNNIFDKVIFLQIKRDLNTNVASVLEARKRQLGSEKQWYSFKIPEYESLRGLAPETQALHQIKYINRAIDNGLSSVDESRKISIKYEDFCENPGSLFSKLCEVLNITGVEYQGPTSFSKTR